MRVDAPARQARLDRLTARIREVEELSGGRRVEDGSVPTGWGPGLARGAVHEWFAGDERTSPTQPLSPHHSSPPHHPPSLFVPPITLLTSLARRASEEGGEGGWVVWIGKRVWPYPRALGGRSTGEEGGPGLLLRSLFIDPPTDGGRLWALDLALRNPGVACVVGDGSRLKMPESRRLQLAAATGRALALLARPAREMSELSAARTRWRVRPEVDDESRRPGRAGGPWLGQGVGGQPPPIAPAGGLRDNRPRWAVELLRDKGAGSTGDGTGGIGGRVVEARVWSVWQDHETGDVSLVAEDGGRSGAPARSATRRTA